MKKLILFLSLMSLHRHLVAETLDLAKYKGKVVYVDFWASWCEPCKKSFPWMNNLKRRYSSKGLHVVAINLDKDKTLADNFLRENKADFEIVFDQEADNAKKFKIKGMPSSAVIDRSGKLIQMHVGFRENETKETETLLKKLLSEGNNEK